MIRSMGLFGLEPLGWDPRAGPWAARYRDRWLRRLDSARRFLVASFVHVPLWPRDASPQCRRATQYGGCCAATGACDRVPPCWRLASCGPTQQAFWIEARCDVADGPRRMISAIEAAGR